MFVQLMSWHRGDCAEELLSYRESQAAGGEQCLCNTPFGLIVHSPNRFKLERRNCKTSLS